MKRRVKMDPEMKEELIKQNEKLYSFGYGTIGEYKGNEEHLVIPDEIVHRKGPADCGFILLHDRDEVMCIDSFAFENYLTLKSVELPQTLRVIKEFAFYGCENLEHVTFRNGIEKIGGMAFSGCDSLKSIVIPDSVTEIGRRAFGYGESMYKVGGFTIYGKKGSEAERYANENGFLFRELNE